VDHSIARLWDRVQLCLQLRCLPSELDAEDNIDIEAIKAVLSARAEIEKEEYESNRNRVNGNLG